MDSENKLGWIDFAVILLIVILLGIALMLAFNNYFGIHYPNFSYS